MKRWKKITIIFFLIMCIGFSMEGKMLPGCMAVKAATYSVTYYTRCSSSCRSLVDGLKQIGVSSTYANRKNIAALNGYSNYTGSASQNTALLKLLKAGKLVKSKKMQGNYSEIPNGIYVIKTALKTSMVMDVYAGNRANGTNIQIYQYNNGNNQKYRITSVGSGWYKIINIATNKAVDVAGGIRASNINVQLYDYNGTDAQLWRFISAGNGYYYIQNKLGYYLDVYNGETANETNIIVYQLNKGNNQKWKLTTAGTRNSGSSEKNNGNESTSTKRGIVTNYMRAMATIRWTPKTTFTHWSGGRNWYAGTYYTGIPYSQRKRETTLEAFKSRLNGSRYNGPAGKSTYMGSDCSSAVSMAWKKADSSFSIRSTSGLLPGNSKISKVGTYSYNSSYHRNNTKSACTKNKETVMTAAYKKLQPGDAVVARNPSGKQIAGHVMLVSSVSSSGIYVIEQTTYDKKLKSTWRVDKYYSFPTLYSKGYLPVRLSTI